MALALRPDSEDSILDRYLDGLPFALTSGQRAALDDVTHDLGTTAPMNRLLQGDVGCGKTAVAMGDLEALGRVMIDNTEGQRGLHEELVGARHQKVIDIAAQYGAPGWKVNGAGGSGGSVTLLADPDAAAKRAMIGAVLAEDRCYQYIPVRLCAEGLRVWESRCANPDGK